VTARKHLRYVIFELLLILIALLFLYPIILVYYNSFKTYGDILTNVVRLPKNLEFKNYVDAWKLMRYPKVLLNTAIVTAGGVLGSILFPSMAAYKMARTKKKYSRVVLAICTAPMMIPFQTIMITLTQVAKQIHLIGSLQGLIIIYWGLFAPFAVFLFYGFVKTVPKELDESASMDGCSSFRTFFSIIFPLMKPVTATAVVINITAIWNDFLVPLLMVYGNKNMRTLQVATYGFFGDYVSQWNLALAGLVMTVTPSIIFFILLQKNIVKGMTAGAIKG
jgi:raffinose/stachyose/melibiose transport system permease protein